MAGVTDVWQMEVRMDVQRFCTYIAPFADSHPCGRQRGVEIIGSLVELKTVRSLSYQIISSAKSRLSAFEQTTLWAFNGRSKPRHPAEFSGRLSNS